MDIYQKSYIDAEEIPLALEDAFERFNDAFETKYSLENVKIGFFTFQNFPSVFRKFCESDFPSWLFENYESPSFYSDAQAMALVEGSSAGILINVSVSFSYLEWVNTLIHELSHIYATQSEYGGRSFYHECCCDAGLSAEEDMLYIGYSVWKEFIADYLTVFATAQPLLTLYRYRGEIKRFDSMITNLKPTSLKAVSLVLVAVFTSKEHLTTESKEEFLDVLEKKTVLNMDEYRNLIKLILDHVRSAETEPQIINDSFIDELGSLVRKIVIDREIRRLRKSTIF